MNLYNFFVLACLFFTFLVSCKNEVIFGNQSLEPVIKVKSAVSPAIANLHIEGMTCEIGCAKTIEKNLSQMDGVQKAVVNFDKKIAVVDYDASILSPKNLSDKVVSSADGKTYRVTKVF